MLKMSLTKLNIVAATETAYAIPTCMILTLSSNIAGTEMREELGTGGIGLPVAANGPLVLSVGEPIAGRTVYFLNTLAAEVHIGAFLGS